MCKFKESKIDEIINDNRKFSELSKEEKNDLVETYRLHGKYFTEKLNQLANVIFNWLFILNSGGLVSVITIFTSNNRPSNLNLYPTCMGICFILGTILIFLATKLSKWQTNKKGKILDKVFCSVTNDQITISEYERQIYSDACPSDVFITCIESLSLIAFIMGLVLGYLALTNSVALM